MGNALSWELEKLLLYQQHLFRHLVPVYTNNDELHHLRHNSIDTISFSRIKYKWHDSGGQKLCGRDFDLALLTSRIFWLCYHGIHTHTSTASSSWLWTPRKCKSNRREYLHSVNLSKIQSFFDLLRSSLVRIRQSVVQISMFLLILSRID